MVVETRVGQIVLTEFRGVWTAATLVRWGRYAAVERVQDQIMGLALRKMVAKLDPAYCD